MKWKALGASHASTIRRAIRSSCGRPQPVEIGRLSAILAAMAIRRIYETPDPVLRQISKPVETFDGTLKTLVADMFETMYEAPGIGLAAVQVGVPIRLLVIDLQEPEQEGGEPVRDPKLFINPEI